MLRGHLICMSIDFDRQKAPVAPTLVHGAGVMPIGECEYCGHDIVAPSDILVWAEDRSFHQTCYQAYLARRTSDQGVRPAI